VSVSCKPSPLPSRASSSGSVASATRSSSNHQAASTEASAPSASAGMCSRSGSPPSPPWRQGRADRDVPRRLRTRHDCHGRLLVLRSSAAGRRGHKSARAWLPPDGCERLPWLRAASALSSKALS
jgi:hypothetical protein